jgi:hypothetical protein
MIRFRAKVGATRFREATDRSRKPFGIVNLRSLKRAQRHGR